MPRSEVRQRALRRVQGVAFLAVVVLLLGITIVIYAKKFPWQSSDEVTVQAQRIGNQLIIPADVKYNGVLVGRVSAVHSNGEQAAITLQIDKSQLSKIPHDVVARILPKTLFGEKYVDLVNPTPAAAAAATVPASPSLTVGQIIPQDRSQTAIELQDVFAKLVPVLKAANPAALSVALSNTAEALQGRGNELGESLAKINQYFAVLNKDMPTIQHDIGGLADLASNYADAAPGLLTTLRNFSQTAKTFTVQQDPFAQFLAGTAGFANTATNVFRKNSKALIQLARTSAPTLNVLAHYSIVLECLPNGLSIFDKTRLEAAFAGGALHVNLIPVNDRGGYKLADKPSLKEFTNAVLPPNCYGLPYDGNALHPVNTKYPFAPGGNYSKGGYAGTSAVTASTSTTSGATNGVGSAAEQGQIAALLTQLEGGSPGSGSGLGDVLLGPMLRGMVVSP